MAKKQKFEGFEEEELEQDKRDSEKAKKREAELEDIRTVLKMPHGRRFIWRYLSLCDRISAMDSGSWTYFKEGERNICLKIKADVVQADPDSFLKMMNEAKGDLQK